MKPADIDKFQMLLTEVMAYYGKNTSPFMMTIFWNAFQNFDFEQFQRAIQRHCTDPESGQFAPKVADIVRIISGTMTDRAAIAWGKVFDAIQRVGMYQDVAFDDSAIHAAIEDVGGWVKICQTKNEDVSYLQHRFCNSYKAYVNRGSFDYPRVLIGDRSPDSFYHQRGIAPPKPMLIGNPKLALTVYQRGNSDSAGNKSITTFKSIENLISRAQANLSDTTFLDAA